MSVTAEDGLYGVYVVWIGKLVYCKIQILNLSKKTGGICINETKTHMNFRSYLSDRMYL